jgi:two-component system, sensor histidine kinase AauS
LNRFSPPNPASKGSGLGLTLSASLAAAAGGSLSVEFPASGGVAFVLLLPLLQPVKAEPI